MFSRAFNALRMFFCAIVFAVPFSYWIASTSPDLNNLALGETTLPVYGSYNNEKIFCGSLKELPDCLGPAKQRSLAKTVVWLGNSQLHAINQPKPGELTAPVILANSLRPLGYEILAMSFPSGSLTEFYLSYLHIREQLGVNVLVVPLFLDDTREGSIREDLSPIVEEVGIRKTLHSNPAGRSILATASTAEKNVRSTESEPVHIRDFTEAWLAEQLQDCCKFQEMREKARGQIAVQAFYLRNRIFGINERTVRPIIPRAYALNLGALEQLLIDAAGARTKVILFIAPIRKDVSPPYDLTEYEHFKQETKALASKHNASWVDFDNIVDGKYWGTKAATRTGGSAELDFMHYQEAGHVILARHMLPLVEDALK